MGASGDNGNPPLLKEYPYDDGIAIPKEVFDDVVYHFECYYNARTPQAQAHQLVKLAEAVGTMKTWHPGYDLEYDTMPWDRDDEEYG